jgi:hypothetical protein
MKYLLALLFAVGVLTAQTPLDPCKKMVSGGNGNVTVGQVVAGVSPYNHASDNYVGIRMPINTSTSVNEEIEKLSKIVYPNPCNGVANINTENVKSFEVFDLLGVTWYSFDNIAGGNSGVRTFELPHRGIYFVRMTSGSGLNYSTTLIFQ